MPIVMLASASIDEDGHAIGGRAGDQNGREVKEQPYYVHKPDGWVVYRPIDPVKAEIIAETAQDVARNNNIGYDQGGRNTLAAIGRLNGWNAKIIDKKCEVDCSKDVQFQLFAAGIVVGKWDDNFRTANMGERMMATGQFQKFTGSKYGKSSVNLKRGDILVTPNPGHTVTVTSDGSNISRKLGDRPLATGSSGPDVEVLQGHLKTLGYGKLLGKWGEHGDGVDGDYGDSTSAAVKKYQSDHGLSATGKASLSTIADIQASIKHKLDPVIIPDEPEPPTDPDDQTDSPVDPVEPPVDSSIIPSYKGQWAVATAKLNVRTGPGTNYACKIQLFKGTGLLYLEEMKDGWYAVMFRGKKHWVSSKYSKLEVLEKYMVDMSVYDHVTDWDTFVKYISFAWLRVACRRDKSTGEVYIDGNFLKYAAELKKRGIPFGVYVYGRAATKAGGIEEAQKAVKWAEPFGPTVYMYDIEAPTLTHVSCQAFITEVKRLTGKPCGIYVGIHWSQVDAGTLVRDYTMCPYYRDNGGGTHGDRNPSHPHDVHQNSCSLVVPGKEDPGDVSHINADPKTNGTGRTIEYFRTGGKVAA